MTTLNKIKQSKELISLLFVHDADYCEILSGFTKENGFAIEACKGFQSALGHAKSKQPDLIIIESDDIISATHLIKELCATGFTFKPAVFLSLAQYPEPDTRLKFFQDGIDDFLIRPVLPEEVRQKAAVYLEKKNISQKYRALSRVHEKATDYLDRFKQELKQTKTELYEERLSLNNTLKQINQMATERTRLKRDIKRFKETLGSNMEGFTQILSDLIKARIEKNRGHGERVAQIAGFLGEQLKIDEKKLKDLRKSAMLHEAGLLFIPEETLRKEKEQRTDFEAGLFMQYPVRGAELLSSCSELSDCADVIRHMNENADGTGRPDGLKKNYIPLLSRILAGADKFDTLREDENIAPLENFLIKLEDYSGTRLDPMIVALLEKYAVLHMGSDAYSIKGKGIYQLEPGMTLGTALFTNTGTKLFSANTLLTQDAIDKIKKYSREYPVDETVYIKV